MYPVKVTAAGCVQVLCVPDRGNIAPPSGNLRVVPKYTDAHFSPERPTFPDEFSSIVATSFRVQFSPIVSNRAVSLSLSVIPSIPHRF